MLEKRSRIWKFNKKEIQRLLDTSSSIVEVLQKLGYSGHSGNHRTLNKRIKEENLSLEKINYNKKIAKSIHMKKLKDKNFIAIEKTFVNSDKFVSGKSLKKKILNNNLKEYKCKICNNEGKWQGKKLSLQLDHINGNNTDNRLENLRFLCPNCHSQTDTYSGKISSIKKKEHMLTCEFCKKHFFATNKKRKYCDKHIDFKKKKFNPKKKELIKKLNEFNWNFCAVGRFYDVSDNAIRKRCKQFKIPLKKESEG